MLFTLWGFHSTHGKDVLKLFTGSLKQCNAEQRRRERDEGWLLAIYKKGEYPTGLEAQSKHLTTNSIPSLNRRTS